uniref:WD repeat domain 90 n=1 Tax=Myripristis murdjan TaxID=586833 RepID=A0A667XMY5_9TELE
MASRVWQHPYVNIFKHVRIEEWKKSAKEGDVATYTDKTLKCSVLRIKGPVPASNYILIPKSSSQSLGLTGHYFYLLFRPTPAKYFVVHLDVAAEEGQVVRVSFSNMFKEFKSTATWLQFPFLCGAAKDSVYESTAKSARRDLVGPAPSMVRWTCLMLDLQYILSVYLSRCHSHLKSIKLCANMSVKNMFTTDLLLDPGVSFSEAKLMGLASSQGTGPMPRDMSFPVPNGDHWHDLYDYIRFPSQGARLPFDSIQKDNLNSVSTQKSPMRKESRCVTISKPVQDRVSLIQQITSPRPVRQTFTLELLICTFSTLSSLCSISHRPASRTSGGADNRGVHVYVHPEDDFSTHREDSEEEKVKFHTDLMLNKLLPDPILRLNQIIGFGGASTKCALWTKSGDAVVYPCHAIIVSMKISSSQQRFFIGHTDKVNVMCFAYL